MLSLEVSQALALDLGLNDEQYNIWTEMEMAAFSILLHCRKYVHGVHRSSACANVEIGASGRCSLPEMNTKRLTSSPVLFRTAVMHGVNSVSSQSTLVDQSTRVMALRN